MPTGDNAQTAEAYYNDLMAHALQGIPAPRTVINWAGPLWIVLFATVLILFFMGYSLWFQHRTLRQDELYRVISFGGTVFERIGGIPVFEGVVWAGIVAWALYYIIGQAINGFYY